MRARLWPILAAAFLLTARVVEGAPEPSVDDTHRLDLTATRVAVRVYNQVDGLTADEQRVVLDVARDVFNTASVGVDWTLCDPGMCLTPPGDALCVRMVTSPKGDATSPVLGHALIDSRTHSGVLATVFIDRTRRLASELGIDYRVVLGRAMAHEIGHLLLGTSTHGAGLMRELWLHDELVGTRRQDWVLDPLDVAVIRDRLARRGIGRSRGAS